MTNQKNTKGDVSRPAELTNRWDLPYPMGKTATLLAHLYQGYRGGIQLLVPRETCWAISNCALVRTPGISRVHYGCNQCQIDVKSIFQIASVRNCTKPKHQISQKSSKSVENLMEIHEVHQSLWSLTAALGYLLSEGVFSLNTVREEVGKKDGGDGKWNAEDRETNAPEVREHIKPQ